MAVLDKLIAVLCISAVVNARTTVVPLEIQTSQEDSYIPLTRQQLPHVERPNVPFIVPEPSDELRPPQYQENSPVTFFEIPVPSTNLKAPSQEVWNPENDPIYFYELPASLTKLDTPTNHFPKKYQKEVHTKNKPFASQPKLEIELVPVEEKELILKKNELEKKYNRLAKNENQKELENLKALSNHKDEPTVAETGLINHQFDNGIEHETDTGFSQGLSADLISSIGIPHHDNTKDRLSFHINGHDGPDTYKWGYDTGKG